MLVLSRTRNGRVFLKVGGVEIVVTVVETTRDRARLGFTAPPEVEILREELVGRPAKREPRA